MPQISPYLGNTEKSFPRQGKLNWVLDWHTVANFGRKPKVSHGEGRAAPHKVDCKTLEMKMSSAQILLHFINLQIVRHFAAKTVHWSLLKSALSKNYKFVHLFIHIYLFLKKGGPSSLSLLKVWTLSLKVEPVPNVTSSNITFYNSFHHLHS